MNYHELTKAISIETGIPLHVFNIDEEPQHLKHDGMGFYISSLESNFTGINCQYAFIKDETRFWKGVRLKMAKSHKQNFLNQLNEIFEENQMETIDLGSDKVKYEYADDGFLVLLIKIEGDNIKLDFAKSYLQ